MGDLVYVKIHPCKQPSLTLGKSFKLSPRFHGPYKVIQKMGEVACKLYLPEGACIIHRVFHVSILKQKIGNKTATNSILPLSDEGDRFKVRYGNIRKEVNEKLKPIRQ